MNVKYYIVYKLKNGMKFALNTSDDTYGKFLTWCYNKDLIDRRYYNYFSEEEIKDSGDIYLAKGFEN